MSPIEMKLNSVMRAMVSCDPVDYEAAMAEIRMYLSTEQSEENGTIPSAREEIISVLLDLGVPGHLKGYPYLITAIGAVVEDPDLIQAITGELYPIVAKAHETTKSRSERAIRHAIETGWDRIDQETMIKYFGNTVSCLKGRPTNSEYIARVADIVRQRMNS